MVIICIEDAGSWITRPLAERHRLRHGVSTPYYIDQMIPTKVMVKYAHISKGRVVHELPHRRHVARLHAVHLWGPKVSSSKALQVHEGTLPCC